MNWLVAIIMAVGLAAGIAASLGHGGPALGNHDSGGYITRGTPW